MIKLKNVSKYYYSKGVIASGFTKVSLNFNLGEFVAITGESGSGKSTLINVISGLDSYEEGEMYVNGKETSHYVSKDWELYRKKYIGNIYQNFNLINSYTVYQNVDLALSLNGVSPVLRRRKVLDLINKVGLNKFKNTKVSKLSGGQKQRVSIARALAKDVPVIVADEPTGNLDKRSSESIIKLLSEVAKDKLVIIVTHNYEQVEDYILLFLVYLFIVVALMTEYGAFKAEEVNIDSYSTMFFSKLDEKRIVVNKEDRSSFTDEEINSIKTISNVDHIVKNDLLIDNKITLVSDSSYLWFDSYIRDNSLLSSVDMGNLPSAPNEIVIEGNKDDYYLTNDVDGLFNTPLYLYNDSDSNVDRSSGETKLYGVDDESEWNKINPNL